MFSAHFNRTLLLTVAAVAAVFVVMHFLPSKPKPVPEAHPSMPTNSGFQYHYTPSAPKVAEAPTNADETVTNAANDSKIPRAKVEAWLAKHNRNAASLLAACRALGDTNYLLEAATNFPNDPQVQLAVLSRNVYPEDRRKWLEAFKVSAPGNSLANYLSASDYFKGGKPDDGLREMLAGSGKKEFQNYAMETMLNSEELFADSGTEARLAATHVMSGMAEEDLPQLASFKAAAQGVGEMMKQKAATGDTQTVNDLAQLGLDFSGKINSGDSGKFLINQLVAMATKAIFLSGLEQNASYDFLDGKTPAETLAELKAQKKEFAQLARTAREQMMNSDAEMNNYMQRLKIYGELETMRWVIQQHPPTAAPQP